MEIVSQRLSHQKRSVNRSHGPMKLELTNMREERC
jgi:hypothetical protein